MNNVYNHAWPKNPLTSFLCLNCFRLPTDSSFKMNFAPFGSSFQGTITGLPQFSSSGNIQTTIVAPTQSSTLVSDTSVVTNIVNLNYNAPTNTNMTSHFNQQTLTSTTTNIPTKFRNDELLTEKYNGGQHLSSTTNSTNQQQQQQPQQQYTVSYNQSSEDKRLVAASITYPTQNTITIASTGSNNQQAQTQEISQDLCNAILQQTQQQQQQINQQQQQQQPNQQQNVDTKRGRKIVFLKGFPILMCSFSRAAKLIKLANFNSFQRHCCRLSFAFTGKLDSIVFTSVSEVLSREY